MDNIICYFMGFFSALLCVMVVNLVNSLNKSKAEMYKSLSVIKIGDKIKINYGATIIKASCINNLPSKKKIYLRKHFSDGYTDEVISYNDADLQNFNTLNKIIYKGLKEELDEKRILAVEQQRFEEAAVLRDAIDALSKTKKTI